VEEPVREFIDGNAAIARGALAAHCDFFAGYPITPATPILLTMMGELPRRGGIAIQGEDEIASLGFCIGAAMAGRRAFTATSGPGISLYSENIGLAIMGEVPLVIVDVQRMGPATGASTTVAQGDVQFIRWCTSGGFPIIALCPATAADCYALTMRAFDLAERFRGPVFLLTDKEVASTMDTVELLPQGTWDKAEGSPLAVRERETAPAECAFVPCDYPAPDQNMPMSPFGGPHLLRFNTSTHDERGFLTKDPAKIERLNRHLLAKIEQHRDEIELVRTDLQPGAEVLLVSYGVTARAVEEAVHIARAAGKPVSAITLLSLWPVPEVALRRAIEGDGSQPGHQRVVVAELNDGQMCREIERLACEWHADGPEQGPPERPQVIGVGRLDGELITPQQILERGGLS
jgi:2-oxoglutarate ferredoxin oxidoreductase subunit alpha